MPALMEYKKYQPHEVAEIFFVKAQPRGKMARTLTSKFPSLRKWIHHPKRGGFSENPREKFNCKGFSPHKIDVFMDHLDTITVCETLAPRRSIIKYHDRIFHALTGMFEILRGSDPDLFMAETIDIEELGSPSFTAAKSATRVFPEINMRLFPVVIENFMGCSIGQPIEHPDPGMGQ